MSILCEINDMHGVSVKGYCKEKCYISYIKFIYLAKYTTV